MIREIIKERIGALVFAFRQSIPKNIPKYICDATLRFGAKFRREDETLQEVQSEIDKHDGWFMKAEKSGEDWVLTLDMPKILAHPEYPEFTSDAVIQTVKRAR